MTDFDDRASAFENKYALDEAQMFRAEARCCKLFGLWVAEKLGFEGETAKSFAADVVGANLDEAGFDDVKRYVTAKLTEKSIILSEKELDAKLAECMMIAQKQIKEEA